jgi:hypothetical protein
MNITFYTEGFETRFGLKSSVPQPPECFSRINTAGVWGRQSPIKEKVKKIKNKNKKNPQKMLALYRRSIFERSEKK